MVQVLEEERKKIRDEYENEMLEMREKYASEQKSKAKMAAEVRKQIKNISIELKNILFFQIQFVFLNVKIFGCSCKNICRLRR